MTSNTEPLMAPLAAVLTSGIDVHFLAALYSPNVLSHAMKVFKMHKKLERLKPTNTETSVLSGEDAVAIGRLRCTCPSLQNARHKAEARVRIA